MFLSFRNIINVFELVGYLKNSISQLGSSIFEFCEKNQTLFELWFYWIWSFDLDWNKIEAKKNLNHLTMLWTPPMGVQKLVSSRAYHRPMCGSGPSHGDIAWP